MQTTQQSCSLAPASVADIPTLIDIEKAVGNQRTYSPMLKESAWKEELKNSTVCLIQCDGAVVGNFSYEQKDSTHVYITGLVIRPEFQRRGIARNILTQFLDERKDVATIGLVTHPDNPALKLYQSVGFVVEGRRENYYGDGQPRLILSRTQVSV